MRWDGAGVEVRPSRGGVGWEGTGSAEGWLWERGAADGSQVIGTRDSHGGLSYVDMPPAVVNCEVCTNTNDVANGKLASAVLRHQ